MPRKAPAFWQEDGCAARLLSPLSYLYTIGHKIKWSMSKPYRASTPVICIGGITAGGSGKTPTLHAFLKLIVDHNLYKRPVILLRGYGGRIKTATLVDPAIHTYEDVGDEALLHAAHAVTIISPNRANGAKLAEKIGADIILMDDGLQNNTLEKTASILVVDDGQGLGNGRVLPAGPLRENLSDVLPRIKAIVQVGTAPIDMSKPVLQAAIMPQYSPALGKTYFGFAGIGVPEKFRQTLLAQGLTLSGFVPFPDHHPYNEADIISLKALAGESVIITTEKDFVRIPPGLRDCIETLPIVMTFKDPGLALDLLKGLS